MYYYKIAELVIESCCELASFGDFGCEAAGADVTLTWTDELPPPGTDLISGSIAHRALSDGWLFHPRHTDRIGVYANRDYTTLRMSGPEKPVVSGAAEWFIRVALECRLARMGYVSLHSAAVEVQGAAYAFSGPSGIGKSTRARAWEDALGARLVSGDRPLIRARDRMLFGVPWDGKEQCFRNVHYPLGAVCEVQRSESVSVQEMSFSERRKFLLSQCFMPMWDTDTAAMQMANIAHLSANADIFRVLSGPSEDDARVLYDLLFAKNNGSCMRTDEEAGGRVRYPG